MTITTVHVKEIGMVAPDMLYVRVRDQEIVQGSLVELSSPDAATIWTNVQRTNPANGQTEWCKIGGMRNGTAKMFQHFYATMPTAYLDRTVVDDISKWASIGGRTVTAVYRKTKPFDQGIAFPNSLGFEVHCVTMEHELFVKLSGNLAQGGPYTVSVTGSTFPATAFTFNDRVTRCPAIRTSLSGHRPGELNKKARLQIWIPGYGTEGRVNYASTYSVSSFDVIDAANATVFTGSASLLYAPTDADEMGVAAQDYPSTTVAPKVATGATRANPCQITVPSHGYTTGQKKAFLVSATPPAVSSMLIRMASTVPSTPSP
jgi:endoglucanase